ncbi:glycosyltransferase family 2 protein [Persicimonas caeni]|uniref:glycosyltransferase family 2 protein n=1 Tax=Persicimonas caeni TaxID=2292766 RepID=UPI001580D1AA|nr:glycosyltransferase family 2 protein [Persicimonas caeni]
MLRAIKKVTPSRLYVIGDGPRTSLPGEHARVERTRQLVGDIDWNCEVKTNFAEENLGWRRRASTGIDWAFEHEEELIILEDDCVPDPTFFRFCAELLDRYRHDSRVMAISGDNFQFGRHSTRFSYYFSHFSHCWGWATWRRAWKLYDRDMSLWPEVRDDNWLDQYFETAAACHYWSEIFERVYRGDIDSWAYIWQFTMFVQRGLCILPAHNLVTNIGFGSSATHTKAADSVLANLETKPMHFPLCHPDFVIRHSQADQFSQRHHFDPIVGVRSLLRRAARYTKYKTRHIIDDLVREN